MKQHRHLQRPGAQSGIALLEALVGILIFAIGVLGVVGLQISMTRAQTQSKYRIDAANLASELIGLISVDVSNVEKYGVKTCPKHPPCADWQQKVGATLPGGAGGAEVQVMSVDAHTVDIAVQWSQPGDDPHTYSTTTTISRRIP
jgi:type IV pilus assembly protein PilV